MDVRMMKIGDGHVVDNGLDGEYVDVVVNDRELLVHNSFIPPRPPLPLKIEHDCYRRQLQDGNTVYIFTTLLLYPID